MLGDAAKLCLAPSSPAWSRDVPTTIPEPDKSHNHFQLRRHRLTADQYRTTRDAAFRIWREVVGIASAA